MIELLIGARADTSGILRPGQEDDPQGGIRGSERPRPRRVQEALPDTDQRSRRSSKGLRRVGRGRGDGDAGTLIERAETWKCKHVLEVETLLPDAEPRICMSMDHGWL